MAETRRLLAVFAVGLLVGVAATVAAGLGFQQSMSVSVPSVTVTDECGDGGESTGWAAQVPNQGYNTVLLNNSIAGPVANSTLEHSEGEYRLLLGTESSADGCHYDAAMSLPTGFESVTVVHDGRDVLTITNRMDASARFWRLNGTG